MMLAGIRFQRLWGLCSAPCGVFCHVDFELGEVTSLALYLLAYRLRHFSPPPRNMPLMASPFQEMHDDWKGPDKWAYRRMTV